MSKSRAGLFLPLLVLSVHSVDGAAQAAHFNYAQLAFSNGFSAPAGVAVDASGNLYVADTGNSAVKEVAPGCVLASCAVTLGSGFSSPRGIAVDASGDVFVADSGNQAVKEMLAVNGSIPASPTINTLGSGFSSPAALAVDQNGNVFVADTGSNTVKEILSAGGYASVRTLSSFSSPSDVSVDASGDVFVTDSNNDVVEEMVAVSGSIPASPTIKTLASGFNRPAGVAVDANGDVFLADSGNGVVKELVAVNGSIPASPTVISFGTGLGTPTDVTLGANGAIYTTDPRNNNAVVLDTQAVNLGTVFVHSDSGIFTLVFTVTSSGTMGAPRLLTMGTSGLDFEAISNGTTCIAGSVTAGSTCILKLYFNPQAAGVRNGAAVLDDGATPANVLATVYLTGTGYGSLADFPPGTISAIAGNGTQGFNHDGFAATASELSSPGSVAFDGAGDIYIADTGNGRVREVNATTGVITTVAGGGSGCGGQTDSLGDGCAATSATLSNPDAVALDGAGNLYIADAGNHRIRMVNASTGVIETVVGGGSGCAGQSDALGDGCAATSAELSSPSAIVLDGVGNLYLADTQDGVRMVSAVTGTIAELAAVGSPAGLALDYAGNLYVSESVSALVQKVNLQTGAITTVAGGGIGCPGETDSSGDGCPATQAKLTSPGGIALDPGGNLYIADQPAGLIRAVSASAGLITTAAGGGTGCAGQTDTVGDGCPATSAQIAPSAISLDAKANLYITDTAGERVRKVDVADPPSLAFPNTPVATVSPTMYVTAESVGKAPLNLGGYSVPGDSGFGIDETNSTCAVTTRVLTPGQTCIAGLTFAPGSTGPTSSAVSFVDDAPGNAPGGGQNIPVSGTGLPEVTPPAPVITSSPASTTIATYATFTFTDTENGINFNCSLNSVPYSSCQSGITYPSLTTPGIYTFYVEAVDDLGTTSTTGTSYTWQVVTPPPIPTFSNGPASTTTLTTAFFTFADTQVGVTFLCSQDSAAFAPCASPVSLAGLTVGAHTFAVEAQAGPGIVSGTNTLSWSINPPPPPTPIATPASNTAANFGTVLVGQTSSSSTLTFTFSLGGTIGSVGALTLGAPNLDFAVLNTSTCVAGHAVATGSSCSVDVTFTPKFAGSRYGAVVLKDAYGNTIGTAYVQGTGSGPQVSFSPYAQTSLGGGFATPSSIAVDGLGNVYVADETDAVKVIPAGCTSAACMTTIGQGFLDVSEPAVDGAGNVFVLEQLSGSLLEIAPGCTSENCVKTLSSTLSTPLDLAVDASGNVFVADAGPVSAGNSVTYPNGSLKEFTVASGYATVNTLATGISLLNSVAIDSAGNAFIGIGNDRVNSAIEEIPAAGGYSTTNVLDTALYSPSSLRMDGEGNLYFIDFGNAAVKLLTAGSNYTAIATLVSYATSAVPYGIALDGSGNVYTAVPDVQGGGVFKLDYADPPSLAFATTSVGLTDMVDGTESVVLENIGNATLNLASVTPPSANFSIVGAATTCSNSSTVAAGSFCTLGVQFAPTAAGALSGSVTFTDNALNVSGTTQKVTLSGAGDSNAAPPPAPTITSEPANPSGMATATFAFTDSQAGVTFLCSLDSAAYAACTSGVSYPSLANGAHVFAVRAADALNDQGAATTYSWTITALPPPNIDQAPANPTTATTAAFSFSDAGAGGSFVCSLDGAAYSACVSGISYSALANGSHTFAVEYKSASSVLSAPAALTWTIAATLAFQPGSTQAFGTVPVGQSGSISLTYTFTASETMGSPVALTEGAPNLDFAVAGGTCSSGSFTVGNTCTVNVTFTPQVSGLRRGAILLLNNTGNTVAMVYVYGIGAGPQVDLLSGYTYGPGSETSIGGGFSSPAGIAVDGAGNTYVADNGADAVRKIPAGCTSASCVITLGTNMNSPYSIAVDGAGNVYVGEIDPSIIQEIPYGCSSPSCFISLGSGFFGPQGVAVDFSGNVFVADYANNAVKEMPPGCASSSCVRTLGSGFIGPEAIAVDAGDNVFVIQYGLSSSAGSGTTGCNSTLCISNTVALMEIPAAGGYSTVKTLVTGFNSPIYLALDGNGNAFITEWNSGNGEVQEVTADSGYASGQPLNINCGSSSGAFCDRTGVAVDGRGDIYVGDSDNHSVLKMNFNTAQPLTFATPTDAGSIDYTDLSETTFILNNGNAPLNISSLAASTNFLEFNGVDPCFTSAPLAPGSLCSAAVAFAPTTSGPLTGTLTFTDNNLNGAGATQQAALSGTGLPPAPTITSEPANGSATGTATFAFTDSASTVTSYLCSLDGAAYAPCSSGVTYSSVALGSHTFSVEGKDSFGNISPATSYTWVEIPSSFVPAPVLTSMPGNPTISTAATFTFTDGEPGVGYSCVLLDTTTFAISGGACISGVTFTTVVGNSYELILTAGDAYGNSSTAVTYSWSVVASIPPPPPPLPALTAGNFGSEPVGQTTAAMTLTIPFTSNGTGTIGSITAVTHGAPNLDFALASGGTCAVGATYTAATTCTVKVTFTPTLTGYRRGGVVVLDTSGNTLAIAYIQGVGTAPQISFLPGIVSVFAGGFEQPLDVAADGAGNIYVANYTSTQIQEFPAGCHQASCSKLVAGMAGGMSVDGAGNLIIGGGNVVYMVPPGCDSVLCQIPIGANWVYPYELTGAGPSFMDGAGNLYIADVYNYGAIPEAFAANNYSQPVELGNGYSYVGPRQVVADVNGNVFVADYGNGGLELPAGCVTASCVKSLFGSSEGFMTGLGLDGVGNAYFVNYQTDSAVVEATVASGYSSYGIVDSGFIASEGLGVDDLGNVYVPNSQYYVTSTNKTIQEIDFNTPPTITFATSTAVGSTDTTDGAQTATIKNNGNQPMTFSGFSVSSPSFAINSAATTCSTTTPLAAQATCNVGVTFAPTSAGALTGTLTVTDNSLNASAAVQLIPLNGTGTGTSSLTATTTALQASSGTVIVGATLTLTATVTPNSGSVVPTGTVTFTAGGVVLGTGTLNGSGVATFRTSKLAVGSYSIVASYGGDSRNSSSTSTAVSVTVSPAVVSTTTVLSASPSVLPAGNPLTLSVEVLPASGSGTATGTVTFYDGATSIGTATLNANGQATLTNTTLAAGSHTLKAAYGGDSNDTASTSAPISVTIQPVVSTTTVLQASSNPIATGSFVTFTATVRPASGSNIPTGIVTFLDGTTSVGASVLNSSGVATLTINTLALGAHSITASYPGDTYDHASTSSPLSLTVSASVVSTTTQLSASAASVPAGGSVTFTAAVVPTKGNGTPTGSVVFLDGSQPLCTATLNTNASATCTSIFTQMGAHSITASYGGDSGDFASVSSALTLNVGVDPSATTLQASTNSIAANNPVTLLANVRPTVGSGIPTGTVTFLDGSTTLGTAALNSRGSASISTSALAVGIHTLTATYAGDSNNLPSNSGSVLLSVTVLSTTTELDASASSVAPGSSVTFTASVIPSSGTGTPTSTVTFKDGAATLGTGTLTAGVATFTTSSLALGSHSITAVYSGDSKDAASTSGVVEVTIAGTSVATNTALHSSTNSLTYGGSVTLTATVTPTSGSGVPTGTASFMDGSTPLGSGSLNGSGVATYSTTFLAVGSHSITASYSGDSRDNASISSAVNVSVTAAPAPQVSLEPLSLVFTAANGSTSTVQSATLTNSGNAALTINQIGVVGANPGAFRETTTCGSTLAAGANCTISVAFAPTSVAGYLATLSVSDSATGSPHTVELSGSGTPATASQAVLSPNPLAFPSTLVGTAAATLPMTLSNPGTAALTITGISVTGTNASSFGQSNNCGTSLAAAGSCTITVIFTPASTGSLSASISVADNATGSPQTAVLSGIGTQPQALLSPNPLAFPNTLVGTAATALPMTLSNPGTAALTITSISVTGANFSSFGESNNCGSSLAVGATCTITVTFTPASAGNLSASISVADNATGSPHTAALTGTGTAPQAVLSPNPLAFPNTTVGTPATALPMTLSNPGTAALTINSISVTGANSGSFGETNNCGSSLAAGATCTITVSFTPASAGNLTASISVADNAAGSPHTAALTGTGTVPLIPQAALSPNPLAFPSTTIGTPATPLPMTLSNSGNAPLTITSISVTGANASSFGETNNCGASLAAGASCTITVSFTPTSAGSLSAAISVTDNAAGSPQSAVVTGTGSASTYAVSFPSPSQSVAPGTLAQFNLTVNPLGGSFNNLVTLSATGLPPGATVSFLPPAVTPGSAGASSVMSIQTPTGLAHLALPGSRRQRPVPLLALLAGLPLLGLAAGRRRFRQRWILLGVAALAALPMLALSGCGGGYFGPPPQTYTITVTGTSGSLAESTTISLTVQ